MQWGGKTHSSANQAPATLKRNAPLSANRLTGAILSTALAPTKIGIDRVSGLLSNEAMHTFYSPKQPHDD